MGDSRTSLPGASMQRHWEDSNWDLTLFRMGSLHNVPLHFGFGRQGFVSSHAYAASEAHQTIET
jgi:hypothetical protein